MPLAAEPAVGSFRMKFRSSRTPGTTSPTRFLPRLDTRRPSRCAEQRRTFALEQHGIEPGGDGQVRVALGGTVCFGGTLGDENRSSPTIGDSRSIAILMLDLLAGTISKDR